MYWQIADLSKFSTPAAVELHRRVGGEPAIWAATLGPNQTGTRFSSGKEPVAAWLSQVLNWNTTCELEAQQSIFNSLLPQCFSRTHNCRFTDSSIGVMLENGLLVGQHKACVGREF